MELDLLFVEDEDGRGDEGDDEAGRDSERGEEIGEIALPR